MRAVSIRQSLLRNLVLIILMIAGGIALITAYGTRQQVSTLSRSIIVDTLNFTEARLREFFQPVPAALQSARGWAELGLLDDLDPQSMGPLFRPLLAQYQQISTVRVAEPGGREYLLTRKDGRWATRETRTETWRTRVRWTEDAARSPDASRFEDSEYDPRDQSWYRRALENAPTADAPAPVATPIVRWTAPYRLPGGAPGITASIAAQSRIGPRVVAFDIKLHSISAFTSALSVSERGGVVVLTDDRRIIGAPGKVLENYGITPQTVLLKRPEDLGWALATDAAEVLREPSLRQTPVRFKSAGEPYWGQARSFSLSAERALFVAVVVPEADLLGTLPELRLWAMAIIAVVLLFAVLQAFALARRYSRPIEALVVESDRISRGDFENPGVIDTSVSEVRRLADAHDRMRTGLKSLMRLERDLMLARRIQQSTFPDRLPVLADYDIDAFSEPAEQTGGDSYDVVARPAPLDSTEKTQAAGDPARVVMLLSDVTGHGIGSALSAVQVRAMLRMAVRIGADLPTIARHLNDQLSADLFGGRFITAWLGELDAHQHTLIYFSAGQAPLIHYRAASNEFDILDAEAPPFGIIESMPIESARPITLGPGDIFAVFSDGVFESPGPDGERFGQQRTLRIIEENRRESGGTILLELRKALADFEAGTQPTDDQTAVIIKRT